MLIAWFFYLQPETGVMAMLEKGIDTSEVNSTVQQWLEIRKEAGEEIDPSTAEVDWAYAQTLDPYGVDPDLSEECAQVGRVYFARSPESDIWVWFGDLPNEVRESLWQMHESKLAFPAGLLDVPLNCDC
jgi:hypothetical protein